MRTEEINLDFSGNCLFGRTCVKTTGLRLSLLLFLQPGTKCEQFARQLRKTRAGDGAKILFAYGHKD